VWRYRSTYALQASRSLHQAPDLDLRNPLLAVNNFECELICSVG
jgi:hypothetical protein